MRAPSYWMRRLFNEVIAYCEGLTPKIEVESEINDSENPVSSRAVKEAIGDIASAIDAINGEEV